MSIDKAPEEISFGEWLRQRRRSLDLTQQALADQVGCARITLRRIESGGRRPSKELALIMLDKLGIPPDEREAWLRFARELSGFPERLADSFVSKPRTNLPSSLTSFIGREKEQAEVLRLVAKNRLVTLIGPGGIGKTSLSLQVGQKLVNDYPNGVWMVRLDSLTDPALVPQSVAFVFDIRDMSESPILERLIFALRTKSTLLILDNCEHLLEPCAQLITTLLMTCSDLHILATSRESLGVVGEAAYSIPSLSIPENNNLSIEKLTEYESIQLFTERANLAFSAFVLTKQNVGTVVDICHRLDGVPLAIELAAARVNMLQVLEILEQLEDSFALLTSNGRTIIQRHQTLHASMDWSWGLLTESEQTLMRQLSVFAGGWSLESAQVVCEGDTLNLISALVKKSLIIVDRVSGQETRYRFHAMIRQYAHEKLVEAREEETIQNLHLKYFLRLSEEAEAELAGPKHREWMEHLSNERDNLRAALEWASQNNAVEAGLHLSSRLRRFWENFNLNEGAHWLDEFIQRAESKVLHQAYAKALCVQAGFFVDMYQLDRAHSAVQEGLTLYRAYGDQHGEIDGLIILADVMFVSGNISQSVELARQALALSESLADTRRKAASLDSLGRYDRDLQRSFIYLEQAIALRQQLESWLGLAGSLSAIGQKAMLNGNLQMAGKYLEQSLSLSRQLKSKAHLIVDLQIYGRLMFSLGGYEQARACLQESIEMSQELGDRISYVWSRAHLGYLALHQRDLSEARDIFSETVRDFFSDKNEDGVVFTLEGIAGLSVAVSKPKIAAQLIGWADATRKQTSDARPQIEQQFVDKIIAACLAKMGEAAFSEVYDEGQKMTLDEAVSYALKED
jgi:predicted ATPase/DNA-binding XRE family transcriptional regulator